VLLAGVNDIAGGRSAAAINADLAAAWDVVHSAGARIIQVLPTPWFGYTGGRAGVGKQLFFNDPTTASKLRAVTEGVRQYIRDSVGQPGGPDDIVETATLGDAQGRLLKKYSWDDLHMNGAGYQALGQLVRPPLIGAAAVAGVAIIDLTGVGAGDDDATAKGLTGYGDDDEAALRAELALVNPVNQPPALDADADDVAAGADVPPWPPTWRRPAAGVLAAAAAAALAFLVPLKILLGVIFKESGFNAKLKGYKNALSSPTFAKSYAKYKDLVIPGKNPRKLKWGQVFGPEDWTAYGLCMTLPFCIYGITVPVGAPISALYDVIPNIRAGAKSLAYWYQQTGGDSWDKALKRYNGSSVYVHQVADNVAELEKAGAVG
jgi:hypothetical protein